MNLEKRFCDIRSFLIEHQYLVEMEALNRFPLVKNQYSPWIDSILSLSETERLDLENNHFAGLKLAPEYLLFLESIKALKEITKETFTVKELDKNLTRKMKQKKRHELSIIKEQVGPLNISHYIDIGSGAAHLSSALLYSNNSLSTCIDMNKDFQAIGKKKLKKYFPDIAKRITFKHQEVQDENSLEGIDSNTMILGLHACGDLSVTIIKAYLSSKADKLLNYGCCYHKLTPRNINLSNVSHSLPLELTNHALTLAALSYKTLDAKDLVQKHKVKKFRYSLHILLKQKCQQDFITLGNAHDADYEGDFTSYAFKYAKKELESISEKEVQLFFENDKTQSSVQQLIALGTIRANIARLIELYITLDRALFLKENGVIVEIKETFNPDLSPRNLSLMASKA